MADWDILRDYVGSLEADDVDEAFIQRCWLLASELIDHKITKADRPVPSIVREEAILTTGANLFNMKNTKNGVQQFATPEGTNPVRLSGIVDKEAVLMLRPYLGYGIG